MGAVSGIGGKKAGGSMHLPSLSSLLPPRAGRRALTLGRG